jgi:hypothetical protein
MARKIKIRQSRKSKLRRSKSRTYKGGSNGGSNGTYFTTLSQDQNRTRIRDRYLQDARDLEASDSGHSKNRQGPGTLSPGNAARYREYNKAIKGNARRE